MNSGEVAIACRPQRHFPHYYFFGNPVMRIPEPVTLAERFVGHE
jgi:hypothetical protein